MAIIAGTRRKPGRVPPPDMVVTITLDDPDLVDEIADANGVGSVVFEGMVACVLPPDSVTGVVVKYVAVDDSHALDGVA